MQSPQVATASSTVNGQLGNDTLTLQGVAVLDANRFVNWERIVLENATLTMAPHNQVDGILTLGDAGTGTGELVIGVGSTVFAGGRNAAVLSFDGTGVTVTNFGTISLVGTDNSAKDVFVIQGDYIGGVGSSLSLNTELKGDGAASDKLVIDGGNASGSTKLHIVDAGGGGKATTGNGILVVEAINGGTTAGGAFVLDGPVAKGAFEYNLFRSSKDGSGLDNWYLRTEGGSEAPCEPEDGSGDSDGDGGGNGGDGGGGGSGNGGGGSGETIGHEGAFRPEVGLYTSSPQLALRYGSMLLDTLHQRKGDDKAAGSGMLNASGPPYVWGRTIGRHGYERCAVNRGKQLDYNLFAFQGGIDLYSAEGANGASEMAGIYAVVGKGHGDSSLFGASVGSNRLNAYTLGGYWTHYGKDGWYLDGLLQGTSYDINADSDRPYSISPNGLGFGASIEVGYPLHLEDGWIIEPQAQVSYQHISIDDASDSAATVSFSDVDSLLGRAGGRLVRIWDLKPEEVNPLPLTAWLRASFAYQFLETPTIGFSADGESQPFKSDFSGPSVILNAGLDTSLRENVSLYANVDYQIEFDDLGQSIGGEIGLKMRW
ncbi:hypothetical protein ATY81_11130 [Rhizobium sp. R72]|nr:hypothetical protein ATY81_11130 [Rhizobium sp. R72]OWV95095.1 hypothetical protein ATY80_11130 [Rhizobium sp. R711]